MKFTKGSAGSTDSSKHAFMWLQQYECETKWNSTYSIAGWLFLKMAPLLRVLDLGNNVQMAKGCYSLSSGSTLKRWKEGERMCICVRVCVCVCVCECERERKYVCVCVCECEIMCVCVCVCECERENVCVCLCVCVCVSVCVCVCASNILSNNTV